MSSEFGALPYIQSMDLGGAEWSSMALLYDNRLVRRKGSLVTADSTAPEGNMVAQNVLSERKSSAWRSDSVATRSLALTPEIVLKFQLSEASDIDFVGYWWSNIQVPWRADLYIGDPDTTGVLSQTTDWTNPIVKSELTDFDYDSFPWKLGPNVEQTKDLANNFRLGSFYHLPEASFGIDYILFRFNVSSGVNGLDDFLQASLFFSGRLFRPTFNYKLGAGLIPIDRSLTKRTASGEKTGISRSVHREFSFSLGSLSDDESFESLFYEWIQREKYLARVFIYTSPEKERRRFFYNGNAFVGTAEEFDAVSVDEHPGTMLGIEVTTNIKAIRIQETD